MGRATPSVIQEGAQQPGSDGERPRVRVNHWIVPLTLVLAAVYLLVAWTLGAVSRLPSTAPLEEAAVTFRSDTAYGTALADATSLGLRLANPCYEVAIAFGDTRISAPPTAVTQEAQFSNDAELTVATTAISPADWMARLAALPEVSTLVSPVISNCFALGGSLVGRLLTAPPAQHAIALHFGSSYVYTTALVVAAQYGLRLTDLCYEAAIAQGKHPVWHSESQQQAFTRTGMLVVAPTILTPNDWLLNLPADVTPAPVITDCVGT